MRSAPKSPFYTPAGETILDQGRASMSAAQDRILAPWQPGSVRHVLAVLTH